VQSPAVFIGSRSRSDNSLTTSVRQYERKSLWKPGPNGMGDRNRSAIPQEEKNSCNRPPDFPLCAVETQIGMKRTDISIFLSTRLAGRSAIASCSECQRAAIAFNLNHERQ
jgi:hypothetical protein